MSKGKTALITGITGQDGSYLAELLIKKNYFVHGLIRRSSTDNTSNLDQIINNQEDQNQLTLHYGDLTDSTSIINIIDKIKPDEIYNLAAQSHVGVSFECPEYTAVTDALGPLRILEAIKLLKLEKKTRIYQASTSELYGLVNEVPQKESTPFHPRSPYGVAKLYAFWITKNYREAYGMYACNGILFNHESPRRGEEFVTRKVTKALSRIHLGIDKYLYIGNINALRDWGSAKDYVEMQWRMLQQKEPKDYVIATGKQSSVREFIELCAKLLNWGGITWEGSGVNEIGKRVDNGELVIKIDPKFFRPSEVESLLGDPSNAKNELGWEPTVTLEEIAKEMLLNDLSIYGNKDKITLNNPGENQ